MGGCFRQSLAGSRGADHDKTFLYGSGHAPDVNLGGYGMVERPDAGANAQVKFGISVLFP